MLKNELRVRLCDEELIQIRDHHYSRLGALYRGESLSKPFFLKGILGVSPTNAYLEPELWVDETLESLSWQSDLAKDYTVFRPLVVESSGGLYGVHFVDKILGANVFFREDVEQWYVEPLDLPIGKLEFPDLDNNETFSMSKRMVERFLEWGVSVPIFGLPTIASSLNIAVNLYSDKLFTAFYDDPEGVHHDLKVINEVLCSLHGWYLEHIPIDQLQPVVAAERCQPPGYGQLCGCSTQLVSPKIYRDFFLYLDENLFNVYPQRKGMIHLCGTHSQHIPIWRESASFKAFQLNDRAAEDLEIYFRELREDQIIYVNLSQDISLENVLDVTKGKRVVIIPEAVGEDLYSKIVSFTEKE